MTQKLQNHIQNGYEFKFGDYLSRGMDIFKVNAGGFIGYALLFAAIYIVASLLGIIPFVGILVSLGYGLFVAPCLAFGYYLVANLSSKGKIAEFGQFFKGFDFIWKLVIISLLVGLISLLIFLPFLVSMGVSVFSFKEDPQAFTAAMLGNFALGIISFFVLLFVTTSWVFASQLAVFHSMEAWQAMEASRKIVMKNPMNWLLMFLFLFVLLIINIIGFCLCLIGLIFTIPFTYCVIHAAFLDIAGLPEDDNQVEDIGAFLEN